jgi:hypothetical protein
VLVDADPTVGPASALRRKLSQSSAVRFPPRPGRQAPRRRRRIWRDVVNLSMASASPEGWTTVTRAARPRRRDTASGAPSMPYRATAHKKPRPGPAAGRTPESLLEGVAADATRLRSCPWWATGGGALAPAAAAGLICLGLGSFGASANARVQLAAALRLRDDAVAPGAPAVLADPAMTLGDSAMARAAGFAVVGSVEEALAAVGRVEGQGTVLLFMPHCERALYEHLLGLLWGPRLERAVVLGNFFSGFYGAGEGPVEGWTYMDAVVADGVAVEAQCGDAATSLRHDAFNDLAVTRFDSARSARFAPGQCWAWRPQGG